MAELANAMRTSHHCSNDYFVQLLGSVYIDGESAPVWHGVCGIAAWRLLLVDGICANKGNFSCMLTVVGVFFKRLRYLPNQQLRSYTILRFSGAASAVERRALAAFAEFFLDPASMRRIHCPDRQFVG
jgi:hypothetical protein